MITSDKFKHLDRLMPHTDINDTVIESLTDYCTRFKTAYPEFPESVIAQWFYEHTDALHQNSWLEYNSLKFELNELSISELFDDCFRFNPFIEQYCEHFRSGQKPPRIQRIAKFIQEHGTWPLPPIALSNKNNDIYFPWGVRCSSPYQLLEGHHRFSALIALSGKTQLRTTHSIWVCNRGVS